jgi:hypothetical protein
MDFEGIAKVGGFIVLVVIFASIYRRRDDIKRRVRFALFTFAIYLVAIYLGVRYGLPGAQPVILGVLAALAATALFPQKKRSRYVPAAESRRVKALHALSTGRKFRKGRDELHHEVPFSKGGNTTADNLRVIDRKENRRLGAKSPWWDVFGR